MPYKVTKYIVRGSTDIPFYRDAHPATPEHETWTNENFVNTGKLISKQTTLTDDNLMCIIETVWDSLESFQEFINDPYCIEQYIGPAIEYDTTNGIFSNTTVEEI